MSDVKTSKPNKSAEKPKEKAVKYIFPHGKRGIIWKGTRYDLKTATDAELKTLADSKCSFVVAK